MDFTGERYVPKLREAQLSYEHWHRYLYASRLVKDKVVLDLACGEGYGAYLMSSHARKVVGADIDPGTVRFASSTYVRNNLEFVVASATTLPADWTGMFDAVVSFETIEHIGESEQKAFLDEVKRVLKPDGVFVVSTPNKLTYTDAPEYVNPFHAKELYLDEYRDLLRGRFGNVRILGQKVSPVSYMWDLSQDLAELAEFRVALTAAGFRPSDDPKPFIYAVAICSDRDIDGIPASILVDVSDALTEEREASLQQLAAHVASLTEDVDMKSRVIEEGQHHVAELTASIESKNQEIQDATAHVAELTKRLSDNDRILRTLAIHSGRASEQLRDENEIAVALDAWIESTKRQVEELRAELQKREQAGVAGSGEVMDLRRSLLEKERLLQEYSAGLAGWEAHWAGVQRSLAWRFLVVPIRRMRRLVAPEKSFRERLWFWMWRRAPGPRTKVREIGDAAEAPAVAALKVGPAETLQAPPLDGGTPTQTAADLLSAGQALEAMAKAKLRMFLAADGRLTFPEVAHPQVSVVIPLYNQAHYTLMTLENLLASESDVPYEVVLVDNGSSDETLQLLGRLENARIHRNETNQGFGEACNRGAEMAFGRYVCFLNNDALPSPSWLGALVGTATRFPRCAAVGGKLVLPDGRLQEAGSIIWEDGSTLGYGRDGDPLAPEFCYTREVDYCSAACLLVEKDLFRSLGGFDARYAPAYYEDADLCMAIRDAGYTVMYEPRAVVLHLEHGSSNRGTAVALQLRNRERFAEKWKAALAGRALPAPATELLRRDSRSGRRVLVIDDRVPELRLGSGFPRTRALLDALAQTGYIVSFLPTADPRPIEPVTSELQEAGLEILYGVTNAEEKLEERAHLYDVVIVSRPHNAKCIESVRRTNPRAAVIYDAEAVYALRESAQAEIQGHPIGERVVEANVRAELAPVSSVELVLTVSEVERAAILRHHPGARVGIWGHAVPVQPGREDFAKRRDIVFVGYLASEPNTDAALHLLNAIMPRVFEQLDCRLILVGADPRHEVREAAKQFGGRVELAGYVENLDEIYNSARVFVAPHRFAAGIPLKVVEAMAHGLPCVVSSLLARQLGITSGEGALVGADADAFAQRVIDLYGDEDLWREARSRALDFIREHHDPEVMKDRLEQWIEGCVTRTQSTQPVISTLARLA